MAAGAQQHATQVLAGRTCLVTGGANGIGLATVVVLAGHGATVHVSDISADNLDRAAVEIAEKGLRDRVVFSACDVTDRSAVQAWVKGALEATGRIDVLVNNAAFIRWKTVEHMTVEEAELSMAVGYNAIVYTTDAVLSTMRAQGAGHIVNVGSSIGRVFTGGTSAAYAATKAAVEGYTAVLYQEMRRTGITVTIVRPGTVRGTQFFGQHVKSTTMSRLADFVPAITPTQVAAGIVKGIAKRRRSVNIPGNLPIFYLLYAAAPGFVERLASLGGGARKDFGAPA